MRVSGMDCAGCAAKIERSLEGLSGVVEVSVSAATERLTISYDAQQITEADIKKRVENLGYTLTDRQSPSQNGHVHNQDCNHGNHSNPALKQDHGHDDDHR